MKNSGFFYDFILTFWHLIGTYSGHYVLFLQLELILLIRLQTKQCLTLKINVMSLIKRNQDSWLPSIFEDLFNEGRLADVSNFGSTLPAVNIKETENDFQVEVAVPGKKKEDFTIELDQNVLTISSEDKNEKEETSEDGRYTRKEFNYSSFKRAFTLPDTVEQEKIEAVYNDGVLNIIVPKREESKQKPKRMIAVS